jgi:hypothetical protein
MTTYYEQPKPRPQGGGRIYGSIFERFWEHTHLDPSGCWVWTGSSTDEGYGFLTTKTYTPPKFVSHRLAYELYRGPIPEGLTIDHLCRNRGCVNPWHLEPVTSKENVLRGIGISAMNARKTHCKHGHEFDIRNTYITKEGERACRMCSRLKQRSYVAAKQAATIG